MDVVVQAQRGSGTGRVDRAFKGGGDGGRLRRPGCNQQDAARFQDGRDPDRDCTLRRRCGIGKIAGFRETGSFVEPDFAGA